MAVSLGSGEKMTSVNWLFGDMSLVIGGDKGSLKIFSLYPHLSLIHI